MTYDITRLPLTFQRKVEVQPPVPPFADGCWIWTAAVAGGMPKRGREHMYGKYWVAAERRTEYAHRYTWQQFRGPIPEGAVLDHEVCSRTLCGNPAHTWPKTREENFLRGRKRGPKPKTHCKYGHPFKGDNLKVRPNKFGGQKVCLTCERERGRAERERGANLVDKTCEVCGSTYLSNKYRESHVCSHSCGATLGYLRKGDET